MRFVYIDESGNTGSNLLDRAQPIFTFVAIGVDKFNLKQLRASALDLKNKYKIKAEELKCTEIFKRGKDGIVREIADLLMENHFNLFIDIAEKKYVIATFIESDFFDPMYNDFTDNTWTQPLPERSENSEFIYKHLSDAAYESCANFYSTGEDIETVYSLICRDIEGQDYKLPLADILKGAKPHLKDLGALKKRQLSEHSTIDSPNFFTFCGLLNSIEYYYEQVVPDKAELIFDSSRQFNVAFLEIFNRLKKATPTAIISPDRIPFLAGYNAIEKLYVQDSKDDIILQCADIFASSINRVMTKIRTQGEEAELNEVEVYILAIAFFHWQKFESLFCSYVCSADLLSRMYITLEKYKPKQ